MTDSERHRPTRMINPLGMRVLVRILPPDQRNTAGLYLPANLAEQGTDALYGEVVEVARTDPDAEEELEGDNVSGIPADAKVLFAPEAGFRVPWDDRLRLVSAKDVLAIVTEIQPMEAH